MLACRQADCMQPVTLDNQQAAVPHLQDSFVDLQMSKHT